MAFTSNTSRQWYTSQKTQSGLWIYNDQSETAAQLGTLNMNVHLPKFAVITGFWVAALSLVTSGGSATISFGTVTTDIASPTSSTAAFMALTAYTGFTSAPLRGVDLDATPLKLYNDVNVTMTVAIAALTGGSLYWFCTYNEFLEGPLVVQPS